MELLYTCIASDSSLNDPSSFELGQILFNMLKFRLFYRTMIRVA